ncbi:hypothetical protein POX_d05231 [Penicillium oxalicum]|uniref:hypothetical protein n=1 Tax=Penicillium oxalicum TaxID=69781 RepID=UPI0020B73ACA|nr:hypothetical protein POX_d05231 [Penicillium oxalicum]KAI2789734.1 hypothetical protein POX_d05231 [Penicillium oxalicum]
MSTSADEPESRAQLQERLEIAWIDVEEALKIAKSPSISVGILHGSKRAPIFQKSSGIANFQTNDAADADTVYNIGGCSQMITCAAIGILVSEKRLGWDDPVRKHIPSFNPQANSDTGDKATLIDLCRHTTGLANPAPVFMGPGGSVLSNAAEHTALVNALPGADHGGKRFRKVWHYSDAAFGLLAQIVEEVAGVPFHEFLRKQIFQPLHMSHTNVSGEEPNDGVKHALPYVNGSDGTWSPIQTSEINLRHGPLVASFGMNSSVNDMLAFTAAVMNRYGHEKGEETPQPLAKPRGRNPLREVTAIWNHEWERPVNDGFNNKPAHTLGWNRTTMPSAALGTGSYNRFSDSEKSYLDPKTIIGKDSEPCTVYNYHGVTNGFVSAVYILPETHTAIVALSNSTSNGDAAETAIRIMLQALLKFKPRVSAFQPLRAARDRCNHAFEKMLAEWNSGCDPALFTGNPQDFVGSYVGLNTIRINITASDSESEPDETKRLTVTFGDYLESKSALEPYTLDMLSFLPKSREELLIRGMLTWTHYKMGIFEFVRDEEDGKVAGFWWQWDAREYPSLWVKDGAGMGPQQIEEVLEKFGRFRVPGKSDSALNGTVNGDTESSAMPDASS